MFFIDDDEAEIGIGQKQRRARAENEFRLASRNRVPVAAAAAARQVPNAIATGRAPKRCVETLDQRRRHRDFGQQHQRLLALAQTFRNRFAEHFGLARAGDAVEEGRRKRGTGADAGLVGAPCPSPLCPQFPDQHFARATFLVRRSNQADE